MRYTAYKARVSILLVLCVVVFNKPVTRNKNTFLLLKVCHTLGVLHSVLYRHAAAAALKGHIVADSCLVKKAVERAGHRRQICHARGNEHHRQNDEQQDNHIHCLFAFQVAFQNVKKHTHSPY